MSRKIKIKQHIRKSTIFSIVKSNTANTSPNLFNFKKHFIFFPFTKRKKRKLNLFKWKNKRILRNFCFKRIRNFRKIRKIPIITATKKQIFKMHNLNRICFMKILRKKKSPIVNSYKGKNLTNLQIFKNSKLSLETNGFLTTKIITRKKRSILYRRHKNIKDNVIYIKKPKKWARWLIRLREKFFLKWQIQQKRQKLVNQLQQKAKIKKCKKNLPAKPKLNKTLTKTKSIISQNRRSVLVKNKKKPIAILKKIAKTQIKIKNKLKKWNKYKKLKFAKN